MTVLDGDTSICNVAGNTEVQTQSTITWFISCKEQMTVLHEIKLKIKMLCYMILHTATPGTEAKADKVQSNKAAAKPELHYKL